MSLEDENRDGIQKPEQASEVPDFSILNIISSANENINEVVNEFSLEKAKSIIIDIQNYLQKKLSNNKVEEKIFKSLYIEDIDSFLNKIKNEETNEYNIFLYLEALQKRILGIHNKELSQQLFKAIANAGVGGEWTEDEWKKTKAASVVAKIGCDLLKKFRKGTFPALEERNLEEEYLIKKASLKN